jgi:hypothetical protein
MIGLRPYRAWDFRKLLWARVTTRTRRDAHALGLGGPEALDVTLDELAAEG